MPIPLMGAALAASAAGGLLGARNTRRAANAQRGFLERANAQAQGLANQRLQVLNGAVDASTGANRVAALDAAEAAARSGYAQALAPNRATPMLAQPQVWTGGGRANDAFLQYRGQRTGAQLALDDQYGKWFAALRGDADNRFADGLARADALNTAGVHGASAEQWLQAGQEAASRVRPNQRMALVSSALQMLGQAGMSGAMGGAGGAVGAGGPVMMSSVAQMSPVANPTPFLSNSNGFFANALRQRGG